MDYTVELEEGVWLAEGEGDPCRTTLEANAERFDSFIEASVALNSARKYRPFPDAEIATDHF